MHEKNYLLGQLYSPMLLILSGLTHKFEVDSIKISHQSLSAM